jgi:hypothetical protein
MQKNILIKMPTVFSDTQFYHNSIVPTLENLEGKAKEFYNMFVSPLMERCAKRHLRRHQGYGMKKKRICGTVNRLRALFIRLNEIGRRNGQKIYDIDILPEIRQVINHDDGGSGISYGHFSNSLLYAISQYIYIFPQDHTAD